ncbi:BRCA1-A complex subunit RAP80 isoform X4 [Takifugu rubripes]|uniref:BRCA1-A complex subunit RAP80 isoform X4 n=1 Tax=Takifugu rubripes TaxID=31033 RepID=UPI001145A49E|nr:BRCA1-A complex subunit RAP80 isoform X4 [Takifugu rubripes]
MRNEGVKDAFDIPAGDRSEDEVLDTRDDSGKPPSSRLSPMTLREKCKQERQNNSRPNEMTEEEMIDLALNLSEQEANIVAIRRQKEEEEAMMKAIRESMRPQNQLCPFQSQSLLDETAAPSMICPRRKLWYSNGNSTSAVSQGASGDICTPKEQRRGTKRSTDESTMSRKRKRKEGSPLLEMPGLPPTQKIYSQTSPSSSDVPDLQLDSLEGSELTQIEECPLQKSPIFPSSYFKAEVHVPRLSQDLLQTCAVLINPVGLNQPSLSGRTAEKLEEESRHAEQQLSSNMTLLWSDEDEDITQVGSPSPVFPDEMPVHRAEEQSTTLNHLPGTSAGPSPTICGFSLSTERGQNFTAAKETIGRQETASKAPECAGSSTVHYYWGVPFCPRGLDPDSYTRVILAQMEVYEKSLKQAQRGLPRKAEWGEAILPQPETSPQSTHQSSADSPQDDFSRRRVLRLRSKKPCEAGDANAEGGEGGGNEGEAEYEPPEKRDEEDGGLMDTDDCRVCPETQLSDMNDDRTRDVIVVADAAAQLPSKSPDLLDVDMILQDDSTAADEQLKEADIDALLESSSEEDVLDRGKTEEDVEMDDLGDGALRRATSPEPDLPVTCQAREPGVNCPMCQRSYPMTEIEVHAAYCDGEETTQDRPEPDFHQASLKPRRKRARKEEEELAESCSTVSNREKCYICQAVVPLRDYGKHTELCIQQSKTENLLSALDKTESRDSEARPSGSKLQPGYVIDLLNDDDDDDVAEEADERAVRISNSPIRSFTPISEATDCLIDFRKQQRSRKLNRRRR